MQLIEEGLGKTRDPRVQFPLQVFWEEAREALAGFYDERGRPRRNDIDALDPAIAALVEHLDAWGKRLGPFRARHDHSSSMDRAAPYLRKLCDPSAAPTEVAGPEENVRFPLQARSIEFIDSTQAPVLQLADVLAGACSFQQGSLVKVSTDLAFARAVAETGVRRLITRFVAPPEFVRRSMEGAMDA